MKICKNCSGMMEDDALVCPFCGVIAKEKESDIGTNSTLPPTNVNGQNSAPKKRITWLWVLGWIFIFPVPLTILLVRNKRMNKPLKIVILAIAWLVFLIVLIGSLGSSDESGQSSNIKEIKFSNDNVVTIKEGETSKEEKVLIEVKNKNSFSPEDVCFVSENADIATIALAKEGLATSLLYTITGVSEGETDVYAMSQDGSVKSETIHIVVSAPIKIETISLDGYTSELFLGETTSIKATITPDNAEDKSIVWKSSDESVVIVDEKGNVYAVGGGEAKVTVASNNGVESNAEFFVDGTKTLMRINVKHPRQDDVNIGDDWNYEFTINGERVTNTIGVSEGDKLIFSAEITESDENPDVGTATTSYTITEDDLINGFEVNLDVRVTENGGRNSGKSALFAVTYSFSPNN